MLMEKVGGVSIQAEYMRSPALSFKPGNLITLMKHESIMVMSSNWAI